MGGRDEEQDICLDLGDLTDLKNRETDKAGTSTHKPMKDLVLQVLYPQFIIMIIIITLFHEDNIFGMNAYGPRGRNAI